MRQSGRFYGFDGERAVVWSLVVAVHVAFLWWLARPIELQLSPESGALQILWIERPVPMHTAAPPVPAPARRTAGAVPPADSAPVEPITSPESVQPAPEPARQSMSAVFLEQGRRWAENAAPIADFRSDPLSDREDLVALPSADRFRMRVQVTPERVAQKVGVLFGGAGYTTDPCPRVRRNLANLGTGGERALVEEEVRRLRQFCQ